MLLARFKVAYSRDLPPRKVLTSSGQLELPVKEVRASVVKLAQNEHMGGWYANTPTGDIQFTVFGPDATPFVKDYEFDAPMIPALKGAETSMATHLISIPEVGSPRPLEVSLKVGESVLFVALGKYPREMVAADGSWTTGKLSNGGREPNPSFEKTFDKPGDYAWHPSDAARIKGVIHVL
jgi:plastocyanin